MVVASFHDSLNRRRVSDYMVVAIVVVHIATSWEVTVGGVLRVGWKVGFGGVMVACSDARAPAYNSLGR